MGKKIPLWVEKLNITSRLSNDLFTCSSDVLGHQYASEMRTGFDLGIDGFHTVENVPVIAFLNQKQNNPQNVSEIHQALWNQGISSLLMVMNDEVLSIYSLALLPSHSEDIETTDHRLIETLNLTLDGLEILQDWLTGVESGRIYEEHKNYFTSKTRIDTVLLENLLDTRKRLEQKGLTISQTQALLMQVMFIAYMEERTILEKKDFQSYSQNKKISGLLDLLEESNPKLLDKVFNQLKQDFNGDIFISPCSFSDEESTPSLSSEHLKILYDFREGLVETTSGQRRFWPYQFKYIPVELISAIYDRFLGVNADNKRNNGEYYTPLFLVDLVINQVLDVYPQYKASNNSQSVLDPSCGSGIFLVRTFQLWVENWRQVNSNQLPDWDTLIAMIDRLHGFDINGDAVRVTVFSLYIALLQQIAPSNIQRLFKQGKRLPNLRGKTIRELDYFQFPDNDQMKFDLIIGNPPWVSRRSGNEGIETAKKWAKLHNKPIPSGQIAWAFVWKTLLHLKENGHWALLLPGMTFLANHDDTVVFARQKLITETQVNRVINLADLRFLLFKGGKHPTALFLGENTQTNNHYDIDYYSPKGDVYLPARQVLLISSLDKTRISTRDLASEPRSFRINMWMRNPEKRLFQWLGTLPKLSACALTYRKSKSKQYSGHKKWILGQGFQPAHIDRVDLGKYKATASQYIEKYPYIDAKETSRIIPLNLLKEPFPGGKYTRRAGFEDGFSGARVIISRGLKSNTSKPVRAFYYDQPLTFQHIVYALKGSEADSEFLKLFTIIMNSRFAAWYLFHTSASIGMEREELHSDDILGLPFPKPGDLENPDEAFSIVKRIVQLFDNLTPGHDFLQSSISQENEDKFNKLVYQYFGLSQQEIALIEDTTKYILPSIQPKLNKIPVLWQSAIHDDFVAYADMLVDRMNHWLKQNHYVRVALMGQTADLAIIRVQLHSKKQRNIDFLSDTKGLHEILKKLWERLSEQNLSSNIHHLPDMRLFLDDSLYIIKPRNLRFWLRTTALADADNLAGDIFSLSADHGHETQGANDASG